MVFNAMGKGACKHCEVYKQCPEKKMRRCRVCWESKCSLKMIPYKTYTVYWSEGYWKRNYVTRMYCKECAKAKNMGIMTRDELEKLLNCEE